MFVSVKTCQGFLKNVKARAGSSDVEHWSLVFLDYKLKTASERPKVS